MRILIINIALVLITLSAQAQDEAFEIAEKSCNCLKEAGKTVEPDQQAECVSNSFADVFIKASDEAKERWSTTTGIQSTMTKVNEILSVTCFEKGAENYQLLAKQYYTNSESEVANSYYITTQKMMSNGEYALAVEGLEIAVSIDSSFVKAYDNLGVSYRKLENHDAAIANYKKSLELFPLGKIALMNLGLVYALNNDSQNSNKYYQRLIDIHPTDAEGYYGIGKNYTIAGNYDLGLKNICQAHQIYTANDSEYQKDSEQIIALIYAQMKKDGDEKQFKKLAKKYNIEID